MIVAYAMFMNDWLQSFEQLNNGVRFLITLFSSILSYSILLNLIILCINNNDYLLKLYYNKLYLDGIWSYSYELENKKYYGIWHIYQTTQRTMIKGYGIDESGKNRSDVRSVTDLIEINGAYEIINVRRDVIEEGKDYYSKTTINPIYSDEKSIFKITYSKNLWGRTEIYGGKLSGNKHTNLHFIKHEGIKNEETLKLKLLEQHSQ